VHKEQSSTDWRAAYPGPLVLVDDKLRISTPSSGRGASACHRVPAQGPLALDPEQMAHPGRCDARGDWGASELEPREDCGS